MPDKHTPALPDDLYPTALTPSERLERDKRDEIARMGRHPKHELFFVHLAVSGGVVLALILTHAVPALIEANILAGTFFSFFLGLFLAFYLWYTGRYSGDVLARRDINPAVFLSLVACIGLICFIVGVLFVSNWLVQYFAGGLIMLGVSYLVLALLVHLRSGRG